ncbi:MAG: amidohydrolase family protein [Sphingomonadales bacterium]|jgi:imidazolonepropionase-like amidohydrolase
MKKEFRNFGLVVLSVVLASCGQAPSVDLALVGVNVINVVTGDIAHNKVILIKNGKIDNIVDVDDFDVRYAKETLEQSGKFVMPGLWDMHIHLRGEGLAAENKEMLDHYLGYGITAVRDAAGDLPQEVIKWRNAINTGTMVGPKIFTALQKLDGFDASWPGSIPIVKESEIEPAINELISFEPDFFKIYTSRLDSKLFLPMVKAIRGKGYKVTGHLPSDVKFEDAIEAGLSGIEHAMYLHKAASVDDGAMSDALRAGERFSSFGRAIENFDRDHALMMFGKMAENGMAITPTIYIDHLLSFLDENNHKGDVELNNIPESFQKTYEGRVNRAATKTPQNWISDHSRMKETMSLIPLLEEAGVLILAGSDSGAFNSYTYPGDSLHQELRLLVESGLSNIGALQAATINGAIWLEVEEQYGSLDIGKEADILVLDRNPLEDINATRDIDGLIRNGLYISKSDLQNYKTLGPNN